MATLSAEYIAKVLNGVLYVRRPTIKGVLEVGAPWQSGPDADCWQFVVKTKDGEFDVAVRVRD